MLWEKELNGDLFVDLLKNVIRKKYSRLNLKKSNEQSLSSRIEGNEKFIANDYEGAMAKYNESICLAETGSEFLGLAYANRSNCFYKLEMYDRCLIDIQLAIKANYPDRLMHKLNYRKAKCISNMLSEELIHHNQPTLSFEADEKLPYMANVIQIGNNELYGRLISAKRDIKIGQTVLIEDSYVNVVHGKKIKCTTCAKEKMNFIACEKCADAMFCNEECINNNFHEVECDLLIYSDFFRENDSAFLILRSVIVGINCFREIPEMIEFVSTCLSTDPKEIPESMISQKEKYCTFFKLSSQISDLEMSTICKTAAYLYHSIIGSPKLLPKFQTQASQRFLIHLIIHHACIIRRNSFGGFSEMPVEIFGKPMPLLNNSNYEQHIALLSSYFNHSCLPNVTNLKRNNLNIVKAILPIRKGDQLFISYVDEDDEKLKTEQGRNDYLENIYGFRCTCTICLRGVLSGTFKLQDDSAFKYVTNAIEKENFNIDTICKIIENCEQFLKKYSNFIPCVESSYILANLQAMLQLKLDYYL